MVDGYTFRVLAENKMSINVLHLFIEFHNVVRCVVLRHAQEKDHLLGEFKE